MFRMVNISAYSILCLLLSLHLLKTANLAQYFFPFSTNLIMWCVCVCVRFSMCIWMPAFTHGPDWYNPLNNYFSNAHDYRAALASAHQAQPLPQTLCVLENTPQVRGMHTIIRSVSCIHEPKIVTFRK